MSKKAYLGIDIGGTGIKGALVDIKTGKLLHDKIRVLTPSPSTPDTLAKAVKEITKQIDIKNKDAGCGFPAILKNGVSLSAANIDKSWIGTNVSKVLQKKTGIRFTVGNDADVAGKAEMKYGRGKGVNGLVIVLTLGTGIGSAVFYDGKLIPNTEFGHLKYKNGIAEHHVSYKLKKINDLSWKDWGKRLNEYFKHLEFIFSPDLIILGGGGSKKFDNYKEYLNLNTKIVSASLLNDAGVIGAAVMAHENSK